MFRAVTTAGRTSSEVRPNGFSHSTCLPACRAPSAMLARDSVDVETTTTSTSARFTASCHIAVWAQFICSPTSRARCGLTSDTVLNWVREFFRMVAIRLLPNRPRPITATPKVFLLVIKELAGNRDAFRALPRPVVFPPRPAKQCQGNGGIREGEIKGNIKQPDADVVTGQRESNDGQRIEHAHSREGNAIKRMSRRQHRS